jgi:hypothetical protein
MTSRRSTGGRDGSHIFSWGGRARGRGKDLGVDIQWNPSNAEYTNATTNQCMFVLLNRKIAQGNISLKKKQLYNILFQDV